MLTLVHHNELIMPAAEAGAFRACSSARRQAAPQRRRVTIHPTTNFHVSALDGASVAQWMRANCATMMKAIDEAVRHGAPSGCERLRGSERCVMPTLHSASIFCPPTGEFTYDTIAYRGAAQRRRARLQPMNTSSRRAAPKTDYSYSIDQLAGRASRMRDGLGRLRLVLRRADAGACHIYPSTNYHRRDVSQAERVRIADDWRCSGLTQNSSRLIPLPTAPAASFVYGGTPSDQSVVRCIRDLKARGFKVVFYPFLLMTAPGFPWRGRDHAMRPNVSSAATSAGQRVPRRGGDLRFHAATRSI